MRTIKPITTVENLTEEELLRLENDFLEKYCKPNKKESFSKNILRICKGHKKQLFLSVIFCVLQLSAMLFIPIATSNIINALVENSSSTAYKILTNLAVALFLLIINYPLQIIYRKLLYNSTRSIEATLRAAIIAKLQRLTISFNKRMASGRIQSKIMRDVDAIRNLIVSILINGTHIIVNLTTIIIVMLIKGCWQLLLFFFLCAPVTLIIVSTLKNAIKEKNHDYRVTMENTTSRVVDMVELIPVTKAHSLENIEVKKMSKLVGDTSKIGYEADMVSSKFLVMIWLIMQFFNLGSLVLITYMAFKGIIKIGDITLYQTYFEKFMGNVSTILNLIPTIIAGSESVSSVGEILKSHSVEDNENKKIVKDLKGEFEFKGVEFHYDDDDRKILNGLNIKIKAGETVAFVGESGSGKSTAMNMLTGFYYSTGGALMVDGTDIKDIDLKSYRNNLAVVPQNSILFSGTIRDNITYGAPKVSEAYLQQIIDLACLRDVIENQPDGLDTLVGERGGNLSGGQKQRISIARALIRNPKVIIFDEATSALDTVSEKHIQTAIDNLSKDKTTFIVAHRLSTIKNADKIAVIKDGKCVEFGTYDELLELKGEFYRFRQMQI